MSRSPFIYTDVSLWGYLRSTLAKDLIPAFSPGLDLENVYLGDALYHLCQKASPALLRGWEGYIQGLDLPCSFKGTVQALLRAQEPVLKEEHFNWHTGDQFRGILPPNFHVFGGQRGNSQFPEDTLWTVLFRQPLFTAPITPSTTGGMQKFLYKEHSFYEESLEDGLYYLLTRDIIHPGERAERHLEGFYHWIKSGQQPSLYGVAREKDYEHLTSWEDVGLVSSAAVYHQQPIFKVGPSVWKLTWSSTHLSVSSDIAFYLLDLGVILNQENFNRFKGFLRDLENEAAKNPGRLLVKTPLNKTS